MKEKLNEDQLNKQIKEQAEANVSETINRKRLLFIYGTCILVMAALLIIDARRISLSKTESGATVIVLGIIFAFAVMTDLPIRIVRKIPIKRSASLLMKEVYECRRIIDERINNAPIAIKDNEENIKFFQNELEEHRLECEEDVKSAEEDIEILEHEVKILQLIKAELFPI